MTKTPEELAQEYENKIAQRDIYAMGTLTQREQDYLKEGFLAGYQAAAPQWISTLEKLPKTLEPVLLFAPSKQEQIAIGFCYSVDRVYAWNVQHVTYSGDDVAYWMPLPKGPQ